MKKILLLLVFLCSGKAISQSDTLQVIIGNSSELIFIAKDPSAYDDLKNYDFNKMLLEMKQKLDDSQTKKAFLKDNSRERYLVKEKKTLSKYYMNYYVGFNFAEDYEIFNGGLISTLLKSYTGNQANTLFNDVSGQEAYVIKVFQSPYLATSVNRHLELYQSGQTSVLLKGGLEAFFSFEKFGKANGNISSNVSNLVKQGVADFPFTPLSRQDTLASGSFVSNSDNILWEYSNGETGTQAFTTVPYNVVKAGFNFKLVPTLVFNDNSQRRVVSLGFGPTVGLNVVGNSITKIKDDIPTTPIVVGGVSATPFRYGLVGELGIGGVTLFAQMIQNKVKNRELEVIQNTITSGTTSTPNRKYMTQVFTFGLKFGK